MVLPESSGSTLALENGRSHEIHDARGQIRGGKPQENSSTGCQARQSLEHGNGPVFQHYQAAVQLVQQGKYEKALAAFEKLLPAAPLEIVERCRMYISTCQRQIG